MARLTNVFLLVASILVVAQSFRLEDKLRSDFNELKQDVEEMMDVNKEDNPLVKRAGEHGCKYDGAKCHNEVYSYGCRDVVESCPLGPRSCAKRGGRCWRQCYSNEKSRCAMIVQNSKYPSVKRCEKDSDCEIGLGNSAANICQHSGIFTKTPKCAV